MKTRYYLESIKYIVILLAMFLIFATELEAQVPPTTFNHSMTLNNKTITVNFTKFSTRGSAFQVFEQVSGGALNDVTSTYSAVRTYVGSVVDHPGAIACAVYRDGGRAIEANVIFESGYQWFDQAGIVTDYSPVDTLVVPNFPTFSLRDGGAGTTLYGADMGIDVANSVVVAAGGSSAAALEMTEFSLLVNNLPFIRDISVINLLRRIVIRADNASDPYSNGSLDIFANAPWASNLSEDLWALASQEVTLPSAVGALGDMALSLVPSEAGGEFGGTLRHEAGHNWGMGHQDGGQPEGKTISSGNELAKFSGPGIENICKRRDEQLAILDNLGVLATPNFPPRAADDIFIYEPSSVTNLFIPVLANDRDVNGSAISILSFDSHTKNGTLISQVGDSLSIPNPTVYSNNPDRFKYRIQDASGKTSTAYVNIQAKIPDDNLSCWTFKGTKNRLFDSGSNGNTGRLYGNASINASDELVLDGNTDFAMAEKLGAVSNTVTFSAFVFSNNNQIEEAGIIMGSDRYGLRMGENNEINFVWNEALSFSLMSIPNNIWTFVALVISPTTSTVYIQPEGGVMTTHSENRQNPIIELVDQIRIGDGGGADLDVTPPYLPYFNGKMDNICIINKALGLGDINLLAARKFGARDPFPYHTEPVPTGNITLTWTPSPDALGQKLFLSTNYTEVKNGTVNAMQSGITASTSSFNTVNNSGSIFWRVETTESDESIHGGSIWNYFAGSKNHTGTCNGLLTTCFAVEKPTGLTTDGTNIYTTGTTGPFEANWVFQQKNLGNCGIPEQCYAQNSFAGNNQSYGTGFMTGNLISAADAGLTAYNHSGVTPCSETWSQVGGFNGVAVADNRLFASEGDYIHELNPSSGAIIASHFVEDVQSVQRITAGPVGTIYFTHFQLGTTGGVGVYNYNSNASNLLPGTAGTMLLNPSGIANDTSGTILVAETDKRRIISIDPNTGSVSTFVDGFVSPSDLILSNGTLYIADKGADEVRAIICNPSQPCPSDLVLTGINTGDDSNDMNRVNNQAGSTIASTQLIMTSGKTIIYNAANNVLLNNGFEIKIPDPLPPSGVLFEVILDGCQ